MNSFIDWIAFTDHQNKKIEIIENVFHYSITELNRLERGMLGYKAMETINDIKILSEGTLEMGQHYILSGQAVRLLERKVKMKGIIRELIKLEVDIARLDIAIDVRQTRGFNLERLKRDIIKGNVQSKWRHSTEIVKRTLADGEIVGDTINLGSRTSNVFLRIYNKELESEKEEFINVIRIELELKKESAENCLKELLEKEVGEVVKGILNNYIRILKPSTQKNKSRWETALYWDKFIQQVEKIKLSNGIIEKTLDQKIEWFEKQVGTTMAMIHIAEEEKLQQILEGGFKRLKEKDLITLDTHLKQKPLQRDI